MSLDADTAALAAICGLMLDDARPRLRDRSRRSGYNGLASIQWEGPWTQPGINPRAAYRYTHWIGARMRRGGVLAIWDVNAMTNHGLGNGWLLGSDWSRAIVPSLTAGIKRATGGWHITHAIEVSQ